jgi:RNA polymerase sigma-70 factor (ECF subfamily)
VSDTARSDSELVLAVRQGNRDAANELVHRYLRGARAIALAVTNDTSMAEDVCQDAFVYAIERIDDCRDGSKFAAWLRQIVRSHARNHLRRERVRTAEPLVESMLGSELDSPAEAAERGNLKERMLAALDELSEERREVVLLHDLEGWTHGDIAERMAIPAGTVRSHLHFARRALRELLRDFREE